MTFRAALVTVTATPTTLMVGTDDDSVMGLNLLVKNPTAGVEVRLGGPNVTWAQGYPLLPGDTLAVDGASSISPPYAITQIGTTAINVLLSNV